ncbi:ferritin-like domain-containing protein [Sphingomonas oryzagri]|uniref:PA2169 family four-helix-bundle protein n=1 Tax=Sphingomonas oryzagri TaxID=3042314 RepID=A0ABT6MYZ2_9SPHN|nr:PA2169 family four-helix-bundle protein [Sphingomonas oryzagri]MDH7638274.1 PA2169 family four-helix-bundle protein [Sphingomonas oryzagri]
MVMFHRYWQSTRDGFRQIFAIEIARENFDAGPDAARGSFRPLPIKENIMDRDHDISVLNGLTTTTLDSMKGYEDAAKDAENTQFAGLFADFARDRGTAATALQTEVKRLGGEPETGSSFLAAAHRTFLDLKQAFTSNNDKAIVNEVERGEDHIKAKFETAMRDERLSPESLAVVREAYTSVRAGHDKMSALKHSMA